MTPTHLRDAALQHHDAGLTIIPISTDGTKRPAVAWKPYQTTPPTRDQIQAWWTSTPAAGIGMLTGTPSGRIEMIELEAAAAHALPALEQEAVRQGLLDLWHAVTRGWVHASPSGGIHWHIRLAPDAGPMPGNTKIARRRDPETSRWQVLAETRGEGGYTVIPPTGGAVHPSGNAWTLLQGSPADAPVLTAEQRDQIHAIIAAVLDEPDPVQENPTPAPLSLTARAAARDDGAKTPGDDYEAATTWAEILTPHGWQIHHQDGHTTHWTRPGKQRSEGVSATTGHADDRDRLYVFTSSTEFEPETPYTKLGAYALLEHGGDHSAAVRELARKGYGDPLPPKATVFDITPQAPAPAAPAAYGNLALHSEADAAAQPADEIDIFETRTLDHTDDWAALSLVAEHGHAIRYVPDRGRWLHWTGHTWELQPSTGGQIRELTKHVARTLPEDSRDETAFKKRFLSATGTSNALTQAQTDPRITVNWDDLDAHPYELNTPGGIVNLRTAQLGPSDPTRLHTRTTTITPDWDTHPGLWTHFLETTFEGQDEHLIPYVQRLLGYSVTGAVTHHVLPFLHGAGANGKSTMLDVVMHLLGGYAGSTPAGFLMQGMQQHETEIARLSGLRFVVASEVNERDRFDEAKVKQLTGGDTLTARFMRQDHFTFTPTHHLWLMGNKQPRVQTGGESFWRRLRMIPFANVVPRAQRDEHLTQKLIDEEGPAILAWIIDGARDATAAGIRDPESVLAATREYASEEDALGQYVEERLRTGTSGHEKAATVRADYEDWCHRNGEQPMSAQVLSRELRTRFDVKLTKSNGTRQYDGVMLYADPDAEPATDHWSDR